MLTEHNIYLKHPKSKSPTITVGNKMKIYPRNSPIQRIV